MVTKLLYLEDFDVTSCRAAVESVSRTEDDRVDVVLNQTCFYPRGGGQDWDVGKINDFEVEEVRLDEQGVAHHIGSGSVQVGNEVSCQVDEPRRKVNTRLHSGGHVIDMAMNAIHPEWIPGRGAHYPHMSFVEYQAVSERPEEDQQMIQQEVDRLLSIDVVNSMKFVTVEELTKLCRHIPEHLPTNKPIRVVLYGDFGVPCGGTHVRKLSDIGKLEITKVKSKKGLTKVSYRVEGIN